jgi:hypothetical protein
MPDLTASFLDPGRRFKRAAPKSDCGEAYGPVGLVMDYYDGNTVTALWNYAQHFAMNDNSFNTTFGPSTPGALNLVAIPLPISPAISADQWLTIPTADCFRERRRQQIKHLRPHMGSAAGLMGNGMTLSRIC